MLFSMKFIHLARRPISQRSTTPPMRAHAQAVAHRDRGRVQYLQERPRRRRSAREGANRFVASTLHGRRAARFVRQKELKVSDMRCILHLVSQSSDTALRLQSILRSSLAAGPSPAGLSRETMQRDAHRAVPGCPAALQNVGKSENPRFFIDFP